jgi:hypothetical protein
LLDGVAAKKYGSRLCVCDASQFPAAVARNALGYRLVLVGRPFLALSIRELPLLVHVEDHGGLCGLDPVRLVDEGVRTAISKLCESGQLEKRPAGEA